MYKTNKQDGFVLGNDGCGVIIAVGEGVADPEKWMGKKVAFLGDGWTKYCEKDPYQLMVFDDDFDLSLASNAFVNPLLACGMFDIVQKRNAKSIIVTASTGALAKILTKLS